MTRVIYIIFTNVDISDANILGKKRYAFLSNDDSIKIGDRIKDKNYSDTMLVTDISLTLTFTDINITSIPNFNSFELKYLNIETINSNNLEQEIITSPNCKRCVTISLDQALEWFNSNNETLKKLALSAYKESELVRDYAYILSKVNVVNRNVYIPSENESNIRALIRLTTIAKYFNGNWVKTMSNTGYFIGNTVTKNFNVNYFDKRINNKYAIYKHMSVSYPGIVYFKDSGDIISAYKIMGEDFNNL